MAPLCQYVYIFLLSALKKTLLAPYREIAAKLMKYLEKGADNDFGGGAVTLKKKLKSKKRASDVFFGGWQCSRKSLSLIKGLVTMFLGAGND